MKKTNNQGMTIVELLVTSSILVVLAGMISIALARTFFVNRFVIEQGLNNTQLQNSIGSFSENLREARQGDDGGYLIVEADDFDLVFFANIDSDPETERVHYYLDGNNLKMGIADPSGFPAQYPSGDEEIKTIGQGITNSAEQPIFYYYNSQYPEDQVNNPMDTPAQVEKVSMVKMDLFANINPNHVPDNMRMETFVRPRNIK